MLARARSCPRLLTFSAQHRAAPVLEFLASELGFDQAQVAAVVKRFPALLNYGQSRDSPVHLQ